MKFQEARTLLAKDKTIQRWWYFVLGFLVCLIPLIIIVGFVVPFVNPETGGDAAIGMILYLIGGIPLLLFLLLLYGVALIGASHLQHWVAILLWILTAISAIVAMPLMVINLVVAILYQLILSRASSLQSPGQRVENQIAPERRFLSAGLRVLWYGILGSLVAWFFLFGWLLIQYFRTAAYNQSFQLFGFILLFILILGGLFRGVLKFRRWTTTILWLLTLAFFALTAPMFFFEILPISVLIVGVLWGAGVAIGNTILMALLLKKRNNEVPTQTEESLPHS